MNKTLEHLWGNAGNAALTVALVLGSVALSTGITPVTLEVPGHTLTNVEPAHAGWDAAVSFLNDNWNDIIAYGYSPWATQVYMNRIDAEDVHRIKAKYGQRSNGVLHGLCVEYVAGAYYPGMRGRFLRTSHRWLFASRVERGGHNNCYMRMPNRVAIGFMDRRGW